jgi:hypothetical protein
VSLANLAREVDVQPRHPGSSPHRREFGFLFSKNQNRCRGFPYRISFQKKYINFDMIFDNLPAKKLVDQDWTSTQWEIKPLVQWFNPHQLGFCWLYSPIWKGPRVPQRYYWKGVHDETFSTYNSIFANVKRYMTHWVDEWFRGRWYHTSTVHLRTYLMSWCKKKI